jgi:hypothetical protein
MKTSSAAKLSSPVKKIPLTTVILDLGKHVAAEVSYGLAADNAVPLTSSEQKQQDRQSANDKPR